MLDETLSTYFPSWLVRLDTAPSSRDPLGLQAHAMGHADKLLPGLNVFTSRARYYTFLCWAIARAQADAPERTHLDRVHRLERLLVLCEALRHEDAPDACSYVGRRRGRRFVTERQGAGLWELPTRILKNQSSNGALRLYRTSLADLELIEEDDLEGGLGLRLTSRGQQLASQLDKVVDERIIAWALEPEPDRKKQRESLCNLAKGMCLSGRIGAYERRHLLTSLFGAEGHGIDRRETVQILFEHDLLAVAPVGADIASADADLVSEEGGKPAEAAADNETRGNWAVLRRALQFPPSNRLHPVQVAGAYQLMALSLNALLASALVPVQQHGRLSILAWHAKVAERAGSHFEESAAQVWAGHRRPVEVADDLLNSDSVSWPEVAMLALELLLRLVLDERCLRWLADGPTPLVERVIIWSRNAGTANARAMAAQLLPDLVEHHAEVSARKGKGEWLVLDGPELVKNDPRLMRPMLHSLRFAQLQQLAADLSLRPEDVTDET